MNLTHATQGVAINPQEVELFVNGLMVGLVNDDNLAAVQECIQDVEGIDVDITAAISDFKKGGMNNLISGAKQIYAAINAAKGDITQCEAMKGDWDRVEKWGKIFKHPGDLTKAVVVNVIKNRGEIASDIKEIRSDESSGNAKDLGTSVANLLVAIIGKVPASSAEVKELESLIVTFNRAEIIQFIDGLVQGLVKDDNLESVDVCVHDAESLDVLLQKAIAEFKAGGLHNIVNGAKAIGELLEQADIDLSQCEAI